MNTNEFDGRLLQEDSSTDDDDVTSEELEFEIASIVGKMLDDVLADKGERGGTKDIVLLGMMLAADVEHHEKWLKLEYSHHAQRSLIRAMFAHVEGSTYILKRVALDYHAKLKQIFSYEEVIFLKEEKKLPGEKLKGGVPKLDENGTIIFNEAQTGFLPNIKFTFNCLAKVTGGASLLNFNDPRYEDFRESIKVRDRLMHPKSTYCLIVTDEELGAARRGYEWFRACNVEAMKAYLQAAESQDADA